MNYSEIDETHGWHFKSDLKKVALSLGYSYISEAMIETYRNTRSCASVGKLFGETPCAISRKFDRWGIKKRPRGGRTTYPYRWYKYLFLPRSFRLHGKASDVGRLCGCSRQYVAEMRRRENGRPRDYSMRKCVQVVVGFGCHSIDLGFM